MSPSTARAPRRAATPVRPALTLASSQPLELPRRAPVEPILKWAGGKTKLLPELVARLPAPPRAGQRPRYFEPFVGGAALFFHTRPERAALSDWNPELIHLYRTIRDDVESLIEDLGRHTHERQYYYAVRALDPATLPPIERASRMVFLNRTCFNGLWRVNREGRFNVPFGSYTNPTICPTDRLRAASAALQGVSLEVRDFEEAVSTAKRGDFVYFDPPYVPLTRTASFTSYTGQGFGAADQERLAALFTRLAERGVNCMLSNSDTPYVRELYRDHHIDRVLAPRSISRDASRREAVGEVIVRSYR